jgi:Flp pilus assembly pilin Flp
MLKLAKKFWNDEQGLELSEYAVMAALIVAALILSVVGLRDAIKTKIDGMTDAISTEGAGT